MKRCARCGETKPLSEFHIHRGRRDGVQTYCKRCRAVTITSGTSGSVARACRHGIGNGDARKWLLSLKRGRPCTDCGRLFPPGVMQWDHLPGVPKLGDISTGLKGRSRDEVLEEIGKCELVCTNCHAMRTFQRAGWVTG